MELSAENLSSGAPDPSGAFSVLATAMRGELKRHCYRMMASVHDAEDCVQEALLRGWREYEGLRDKTAGRPWLYSIATRVCLDALRSRRRRQTLFGPSLDEAAPGKEPWVEPWVGESGDDIRLAFVSLLHGLSPRARAVLLLHDAVGMTAGEAAEALGLSLAAARSALQRARTQVPAPAPERTAVPVDAYVAAWNEGDLPALIGLLRGDIVMTMPPWQRTFVGLSEVEAFMRLVWPRHDGFRATALTANGQPAVAVYTKQGDGPYRAHSLHVLAGEGLLSELVLYAPPLGAELFAAFGLPVSV
jgi:RNA polymerase sigma-70 factor (ECF subfamily)